jgi:hypothetical protein
MIESLLLTVVRVSTFEKQQLLTNATGFFFERDQRLFLVTSRHVMIDEPSKHFPDRIEIELHVDADNMANSTGRGFGAELCLVCRCPVNTHRKLNGGRPSAQNDDLADYCQKAEKTDCSIIRPS